MDEVLNIHTKEFWEVVRDEYNRGLEINHDDYHICVLSKTFKKEWGFSGNEHIRKLSLFFLNDNMDYYDFSSSSGIILFYMHYDIPDKRMLVRKDFIEWCVVKFGGIAADA